MQSHTLDTIAIWKPSPLPWGFIILGSTPWVAQILSLIKKGSLTKENCIFDRDRSGPLRSLPPEFLFPCLFPFTALKNSSGEDGDDWWRPLVAGGEVGVCLCFDCWCFFFFLWWVLGFGVVTCYVSWEIFWIGRSVLYKATSLFMHAECLQESPWGRVLCYVDSFVEFVVSCTCLVLRWPPWVAQICLDQKYSFPSSNCLFWPKDRSGPLMEYSPRHRITNPGGGRDTSLFFHHNIIK